MSTLLNKYHEFNEVKLSVRGRGAGGDQKSQKIVNLVCEGPSVTYLLVEQGSG